MGEITWQEALKKVIKARAMDLLGFIFIPFFQGFNFAAKSESNMNK